MRSGGDYCMAVRKRIIMANNPLLGLLLAELPDSGTLPTLKQLEARASPAQSDSSCTDSAQNCWPTDWRVSLGDLAQQCATAAAEPLEVFTRSAVCTTHVRARHDMEDGMLAARLQRLQAIQASLTMSSTAEPKRGEIEQVLGVAVGRLAKHGIAPSLHNLILNTLHYTILLLRADRLPENKRGLTSGAQSSFTICIDHMLPGV